MIDPQFQELLDNLPGGTESRTSMNRRHAEMGRLLRAVGEASVASQGQGHKARVFEAIRGFEESRKAKEVRHERSEP